MFFVKFGLESLALKQFCRCVADCFLSYRVFCPPKSSAPNKCQNIVDVRMAPIDGFEFLRVLRGSGNNTPVILVTGDSNPDLLSEANKFGVAAVMMKPVQRDRLIQTIARTLKVR